MANLSPAFKVIAFMFIFNISVGIMTTALPEIFNPGNTGGLFYQPNQSNEFTTDMQKIITPSGELENAGDQIYRVLDLTIIGFIERALNTIKNYLFGFVHLLDILVGGYIAVDNQTLRDFLFDAPLGIFYVATTIAYIYGAFELWTGKAFSG